MMLMGIRNMKVEDVEAVARMVALYHDNSLENGYNKAGDCTLGHLKNCAPALLCCGKCR